MLRINNTTFNTNMETVLKELRKELAKQGSQLLQREPKLLNGYLMVCCPYHKNGLEKKPSAQFRIEDGLFYCFACQEVHSLPEVITHCLHTNGWRWLRDNFEFETIESRNLQIDFNKDKETKETIKYIDPKELEKYRFIHPYMYERKLDLQTIRKFDIGYDKDYILTTINNNGEKVEHHMGECLTFPVKDINGNILFIARRSIHTKWFNYQKDSQKPLYGHYEILREIKHGTKINEIYITESMLDSLRIWSYGKFSIALNGLGSKEQIKLLETLPVRTLILALDNDEKGRQARIKIKSAIKTKFIKEISYESYGNCKDINDMTKEQFLNAKIIM